MTAKTSPYKQSHKCVVAAVPQLTELPLLASQKLIEITRGHLGQAASLPKSGLRPLYNPSAPPSEANLCDWIASALVGHCIQYHDGLLLRDRSETTSELSTKERARIHAVARRAWIACELGLVHLFSQRVGEDHYRYLAMRSSCTLKPPEIRTQVCIAQLASVSRNLH